MRLLIANKFLFDLETSESAIGLLEEINLKPFLVRPVMPRAIIWFYIFSGQWSGQRSGRCYVRSGQWSAQSLFSLANGCQSLFGLAKVYSAWPIPVLGRGLHAGYSGC